MAEDVRQPEIHHVGSAVILNSDNGCSRERGERIEEGCCATVNLHGGMIRPFILDENLLNS